MIAFGVGKTRERTWGRIYEYIASVAVAVAVASVVVEGRLLTSSSWPAREAESLNSAMLACYVQS
jgi:hypothetical protein